MASKSTYFYLKLTQRFSNVNPKKWKCDAGFDVYSTFETACFSGKKIVNAHTFLVKLQSS